MSISEKLLTEILKWDVVEVPTLFYHGCRENDFGINLKTNTITGNKWFSENEQIASNYAWFWRRPRTSKPFCLKLKLKKPILAIKRPSRFDVNEQWIRFLEECFPNLFAYDLSINFQNTLSEYLKIKNQKSVYAYLSFGGDEICIPSCEQHVTIVKQKEFTEDKEVYQNIST